MVAQRGKMFDTLIQLITYGPIPYLIFSWSILAAFGVSVAGVMAMGKWKIWYNQRD